MAPFWSCWWGCGVERERKAFREYTQMRAARNRQETAGNLRETIIDGEVMPSSLADIAPILRVANEVERRNPRVAYLCRSYAFEKAQELDPTSSGHHDVCQFKTALLQQLERDKYLTLMGRAENSDLSELRSFYQLHVEDINDLQNAAVIDRPQLTKAYCTSGILCEVLKPLIARQIAQTRTAENLGETFFDSEVLPSMLLEISPILHVASEVVKSNPRVAYLCRAYAFEKAQKLDPRSCGHGVCKFKTALLN